MSKEGFSEDILLSWPALYLPFVIFVGDTLEFGQKRPKDKETKRQKDKETKRQKDKKKKRQNDKRMNRQKDKKHEFDDS